MQELKELGLSSNEIKIYLMLLELGGSLAGLISRKTGVHRRSVYDSLERLIAKGLVGYIVKNNRRYYEAVNPSVLKEILKAKEDSIEKILPELLLKYKLSKEKNEVLFFKGKNGLKSVFDDQIATGSEVLIIGGSLEAYNVLRFYFGHYDKARVKKGIKVRVLFSGSKENFRVPLSSVKYMPPGFSGVASTNIYGDKVAIIFWSRENPFAILIKQKEIADAYRGYFEMLWGKV